MKLNKMMLIAVIVSIAIVISFIEKGLGFLTFIPGAKLGLANMITIICLYTFGVRTTATILFYRIAIVGFFSGSAISFLYSIAGGLVAFAIMSILILDKGRYFSIIGVSIAGATTHVTAQLFVAIILFKTDKVLYYAPYILLISVFTGSLIAMLSHSIINRKVIMNLERYK